MTTLGVIGNISVDTARSPDGRSRTLLGGAALYVALAASKAGLTAGPVSVVGGDLADLRTDPRLAGLDLRRVMTVPGRGCRFGLTYDRDGQVTAVDADYGVADALTAHAVTVVADRRYDRWHVACRRPLDTARVLPRIAAAERPFSLDFHLASAAEQIGAASALLPQADVVFVNAAEHRVLARHVDLGTLPAVVVSDGPRDAALLRYGRPVATAVPPVITAREITGAGDTLAGTFLALTSHGASDRDALTGAVAAASRRAASPGLRLHPRS